MTDMVGFYSEFRMIQFIQPEKQFRQQKTYGPHTGDPTLIMVTVIVCQSGQALAVHQTVSWPFTHHDSLNP
jgi:hypothetical protein